MQKVHRGSNSRGRRRYHRFMVRMGVIPERPPVTEFMVGCVARIRSDAYGQRYNGARVTVEGQDENGSIIVKSPKRKSPLIVLPLHLEREAA